MLNAGPTTEQAIVDAVVALLSAVPGMVTACDGRVTPFNEAEMPAANVFTPTSAGNSVGMGHMDHELKLNIVLYLMDKTAQKAVRSLVARIYAAIGAAEATGLGPFAVPGVIRVEDPGKAVKCIQQGDFIGSAQIALTITYRTARWAL